MRRTRRTRRFLGSSVSLASIVMSLVFGLILASPAGTAADSALDSMAPSVPLTGKPFGGTPAVGALFVNGSGGAASHFCTASVVHSPHHNLVVTAAHCLGSLTENPQNITFVPGYHDRKTPYGVWTTARIVVDHAWASSADPDDDVAFLVMAAQGHARIEDVTGAERLHIGQTPTGIVRVIGYPNTQERPVTCQNRTVVISATQLRFDCGGFTEGTSGGPLLADMSQASGTGLIVGIVGGYEEGGYTPEISYSPMFGANIAALYSAAVAAS